MASSTAPNPRRLAANRANARRSTGPRTAEGKARSSLNAVKTGLTGRTLLLPGEDVARYEAHVERFQRELKPVGELEANLVQSLADTQWRLNRIPGLETALLALGRKRCAPDLFAEEKDPAVREMLLEAHIFTTEAPALKNLYLQESRLRRQYTRDLRELDKLRAERAEIERKKELDRAWARELQSIRNCGCEQCQRWRGISPRNPCRIRRLPLRWLRIYKPLRRPSNRSRTTGRQTNNVLCRQLIV